MSLHRKMVNNFPLLIWIFYFTLTNDRLTTTLYGKCKWLSKIWQSSTFHIYIVIFHSRLLITREVPHIPLCVERGGWMGTREDPCKNRFSTSPCRKRRLNGAVHRMKPEKPRPHVTAGVARYRSLPAQRPWAPSIGLNFAALHWPWWRLHISEIFFSGT
jgi:hypothetical protein